MYLGRDYDSSRSTGTGSKHVWTDNAVSLKNQIDATIYRDRRAMKLLVTNLSKRELPWPRTCPDDVTVRFLFCGPQWSHSF